MKNRNIHRQCSFVIVFLLILFIDLYGQVKKTVPFAEVLEYISSNHDVYFTYNPILLNNEEIDIVPFQGISLEQSISIIKKLPKYEIEYLGNNYYVVFIPKKNKKLVQKKDSVKNSSFFKSDSLEISNNNVRTVIRGVVLNSYYQPISKANVIENNTNNGTITRHDGSFQLELENNNLITISHVGHSAKSLSPSSDYMKVILKSGLQLDEVFIVGSRNVNRKKIDSPVSTESIDVQSVINKSDVLQVNQLIQTEIPSFNATKQSGSDGADHIIPATYRGLGPDQTLVLINGKRRHQTSLINLYGTRGRGNSGTDLNTIPTSDRKSTRLNSSH